MKLTELEYLEYARYIKEFNFFETIKGKTFLVTGGNGMTGSGIIKWLLFENQLHSANAKIYVSTRYPEVIPDYIDDTDNIEFCKFGEEDIIFSEVMVDYVIHCASPTGRAFFVKYPYETVNIILDGTRKMIELLKSQKGGSMVFLSSVEVYGLPDTDTAINESYVGAIDSLNIRNSYPIGKKAAEYLCFSACEEYDLDIKISRLSAIQGLSQPYNEQRIFNELLRCIIENKNLIMKSDGLSKKSIIYTLDAISGIFTILFKGRKGEVYNITNPSTYLTMNELANFLFRNFSPELRIEYELQKESITGYLPHLNFTQDINKIINLGWRPITDLKQIYSVDLKRFGYVFK